MPIDITSLLKNVTTELNAFAEAGEEAAEKTTTSLAENLLAQEEALRESYERRRDMMMEAAEEAEEGLTAAMMQAAQERNSMIAALDMKNMQSGLARYQQTYNGIGSIIGDFISQLGGDYSEMFNLSKAFATADTAIQIANAMAKAAATPFPANLAAMATVAASTAGLLSQIKGTNFAGGFDMGGNIMAGKWGIVGEYGPEIIRGPANVTSREETAELAKEAMANRENQQPTQNISITLTDSSGNITDQIFKEIRSGQMDSVIVEIAAKMRSMGIV